ncbi:MULTISPECIES: sn-glycerol-3-phosphate ABC transporter ATP-binding protein UgpC [Treponema]|uniref:Multiple sugar transport system ATP-binding protein n=1 Tax=Treponema rectale TaxID=744512 RepID=A0A840SE58_9SPIR|nr:MULTISPECIES: sn-glycerol-3-phosphate ABC transporter ATP-binding protein UgpC [Treponema]MBB5217853.1 multiple sugar transport system ATP-binding protein [Treponema rectale]MBE6353632.1 sn-glycerol-3-phosphate ABC transporter ATP-binding protein UgpC [Treponema sp.]MBO6176644.1 sn-glycerol-3-phosphate ABC transporter ATP-binding protein UgpC [Treponema sp.]QOS40423.1 sn-glycerol-3-phosphate ABC transporter ATP-binding protein UgpC [Treponema rectale]
MAKVELKGIGKIYDGGVHAVQNANITIEDKDFCVFVGPSGCGKSTTLRMIAGLEEISEGELLIDGELMNDVPPKDRNIAMVFQNYALYPHMTVYDNMAFGLKIRKMDKAEIRRRVDEAATSLGLTQYLDRKPKALSGGQRQRVAVGRAIVRNPKVFLFDEPLSNLDAKLRVTMRGEIAALHQRLQATMIYVTHDQIEAMTMGTKIVVMKDGHVQQIGEPLFLYNHPINKFVAGFIGSPPMNFLTVTIKKKGDAIIADEGTFELVPTAEQQVALKEYVGKDVYFGVRPEDLAYGDAPFAENNMQMKVSNKEPLGAETHLFLATKGQNIIARVQASAKESFKLGETVNFQPAMNRCKFFVKNPEDLDAELNICERIEAPWLVNALTGEVGYKKDEGFIADASANDNM